MENEAADDKFNCFWIKAEHHEKLPAGSARTRKRPGKGGRDGGENALRGTDNQTAKQSVVAGCEGGTSAKASHALPTRQ